MNPREKELVDEWIDFVTRQAKRAKIELIIWKIETSATQGVPDLWVCVDGVPVWLECKRFKKCQEIIYQPNQKKNLYFLKQQNHKCATLVMDEETQCWYLPPPQTAMDVGARTDGKSLRTTRKYEVTEALLGLLATAYGDLNMATERLGVWKIKEE